jgi:TonB family protein
MPIRFLLLVAIAAAAACSPSKTKGLVPVARPEQEQAPICALRAAGDTIWTRADLDQPLRLEAIEPPHYPLDLQMERQGGRVEWSFVIQPNGRIDPCTLVLQSTTLAAFVAPARKSVVSARFAPPLRHGVAVYVHATQTIKFVVGM